MTLACTRPEETCFCQAFGVDPAQPQGDVSCWMRRSETLYWQANTEKGEALTAKLSMLEDADDEAVKAQQDADARDPQKAAAGKPRSVRRRRGEDESAL